MNSSDWKMISVGLRLIVHALQHLRHMSFSVIAIVFNDNKPPSGIVARKPAILEFR